MLRPASRSRVLLATIQPRERPDANLQIPCADAQIPGSKDADLICINSPFPTAQISITMS